MGLGVPLAEPALSIQTLATPIERSGSVYIACPAAGKPQGLVAM